MIKFAEIEGLRLRCAAHLLNRLGGRASLTLTRQEVRAISLLLWDRKIYPLIEEYFFDQPDIAKAFSVDRFWPRAIV